MNHSADVSLREAASLNSTTAIPTDDYLATNNLFCGLLGIPFNFLIAVFIVSTRSLQQTRNIVWLGVAFSNVLVLFQHLVEFYDYVYQSEEAKKIFSLVAGLPFISLALNLFLSLVDRYICIAHSGWYRRNVTITWIISGEIGCFFILCVITKGPYLLKNIPLPTEVTITDMKISSIVLSIVLLLCIAGQLLVYFKVKYYLELERDAYPPLSSQTAKRSYSARQRQAVNNTQSADFMEGEGEPLEENSVDDFGHRVAAASLQNPAVITPSPFFIYIRDEEIWLCRLDLKAARHAVDSVSLLLASFLPTFTTLMFSISADCSCANRPFRQECSTYLWALAYTRGLMGVYTIVNPIFFFGRSPDLSQALNRCHNSQALLDRRG